MGAWGSGLYANDCTSDVRDSYMDFLRNGLSNMEAYEKTLEEYQELMGDEDEPFFWYALAETQWKTGRLMPEVKEKALRWIEKRGGLALWEDSANHGAGWKKTLQKLKLKLESPVPPEKKIRKPVEFDKHPWNINDVYAYQFHKEETKELGLFGKYILIQKIGEGEDSEGEILSIIHVLDRVFDELPTLEDVKGIRILPVVFKRFCRKDNMEWFSVQMNCMMDWYRKSDYPAKYLTFIGNTIGPPNKRLFSHPSEASYWCNVEDWLANFYLDWQGVEYETVEEGIYSYVDD